MEKLQSVKGKAIDTKATLENLDLKGKMHNVQNDFFVGWRNIADKARKEAKTLNKKARKALATYEEGSSVRYDQIYDCNFDTGFDIWRKFQKHWINVREQTMENARKAELTDTVIAQIVKDWRKWESLVHTLRNHLVSLPDVIGHVEIAQNQICTIGNQLLKIDKLMLDFEDLCEQVEVEKQKFKQKAELSQLVEKRQSQFHSARETSEMTVEECMQMARVVERQESIEKQQIYEDAFLEQMDRYVKYGELEKPIAGSVGHEETFEDPSFDVADLNALKEFLGPEELNSVLQSQLTTETCKHNLQKTDESNATSQIEQSLENRTEDQHVDNIQCPKDENGSDENELETDLDPAEKPASLSEIKTRVEIEVQKEADSFKSGTRKEAEKNNGSGKVEWLSAEENGQTFNVGE